MRFIVYLTIYLKIQIVFFKKIYRIYKKIHPPVWPKNYDYILNKHRLLWNKLSKFTSFLWIKTYIAISGKYDYRYVPENIYYAVIEPILNNKMFSKAYADKNIYSILLSEFSFLLPKIILRNIDGHYFSENYEIIDFNKYFIKRYLNNHNKIIIKKAIDSGGGKSIELFTKKIGEFYNTKKEKLTVSYLKNKYERNYIIQEYINQHKYYARFNKSSLNTVRILTYRSIRNDEVHILHALLRIGRKGSHVDNQSSGGLSIGLSSDGSLNNYAVDKEGNKHYSNILNNNKIIYFREMKEYAVQIAHKMLYSRLIGFDFCVDYNGKIKLIELNNQNNEINFYQMNNGPLFREFTDEIIEYCRNNPQTFCIDYYI